jgi:hypothetical protein
MNKSEVIAHFGGVGATAKALDMSQPSVTTWGEHSIPELRQLQIEALTKGLLRAGPECDAYRVAPVPTPAQ